MIGGVDVRFSRFPCDIREAGFSTQEAARIQAVQADVGNAAAAFVVPPWRINGVIWVESRFYPQAVSKAGALGLMQLMPRTGAEMAKQYGVRWEPFNPERNIFLGTGFLSTLYRRLDRPGSGAELLEKIRAEGPEYADFDTWDAAHAAYFAGLRGIRGKKVNRGRVRRYVEAVRAATRRFRDLEAFCQGKPAWEPPSPRPRPSRSDVPTQPTPAPSRSDVAPTRSTGGEPLLLLLALFALGKGDVESWLL